MIFMPSFSASLIGFGVLALLGLANWYVSGLSVEPGPAHTGEDHSGDFYKRKAHIGADELKKVA